MATSTVWAFGSIYRMLKKMGLPDDKRNYDRFKSAIDRLTTMSIISDNAFWDREGQCYLSRRDFTSLMSTNL